MEKDKTSAMNLGTPFVGYSIPNFIILGTTISEQSHVRTHTLKNKNCSQFEFSNLPSINSLPKYQVGSGAPIAIKLF